MRPVLRPGLRVLRRDVRTLQLGLDWPGLCTLPDNAAVRAVLAAIDGFRDLHGVLLAAADGGVAYHDVRQALEVLLDCGAVVDQASRRPRDVDETTWTAWWLLAGPGRSAQDIAAERSRRHVRVCGSGQIAERIGLLLNAAHIAWSAEDNPAAGGNLRRTSAVDLVLLTGDEEPDRSLADRYLRDGTPHLWASVRDIVGIVGPFVLPGVTGCLRCADLIRTETDSSWPTLLESARVRQPPHTPADPLVAALVAAWAASEVAVWASGLRPQTLNALLEMPQGFGAVDRFEVQMHPSCGCGWP